MRPLTRLKREVVWPLTLVLLLMRLGMGLLVWALRATAMRQMALAARLPVRILRAVRNWKEQTLLH